MSKIIIVSIGINNYKEDGVSNLDYCQNDAKLIFEGYSKYNCHYKNLLINEQASKESILKALKDIQKDSRDTDYFIFNFAGHGTVNNNSNNIKSENCFICPYNFNPEYLEITGISLKELNQEIKLIPAKQKLLIIDACHSGGALRRKQSKLNLREIKSSELIDILSKQEGSAILTACDSDELAEEVPELKHGLFTYTFTNILENSKKDYIKFKELLIKLKKEISQKTNNKQNPQGKCNNEDFNIPKISKNININNTINLDLDIIPTIKEKNISQFNQFEDKIIYLIENKKDIELDKTLKFQINSAYEKIKQLIHNENNNLNLNVIQKYEESRNQIEPIILMFNYILEYGNNNIILNNLDLILRFEKISENVSGLSALVEIPYTIISEIIFKLLGLAYKHKNEKIILKFFNYSSSYFSGKRVPFIYDSKIWHPEIFKTDVKKYFEYLFPQDKLKNNLLLNEDMLNLQKIIFLIDSFQITNDNYISFPIYKYYNPEIGNELLQEFDKSEFTKFLFKIFKKNKEDFIQLIIQRLQIVSKYRDFNSWEFSDSINFTIKNYQKLIQN